MSASGASPSRQAGATALLSDVVGLLESWYPLDRAEEWDRVGLILGEADAPVRHVLLAVDPTVGVAREAAPFDLLVTHHPLLLRGATHLPATTGKGAVVTDLIRSDTALWCGHTNADRSERGTATALADAIGLRDREALVPPERREPGLVGLGLTGVLPEPTTVRALAASLAAALPATVQGAKYTGDPERRVERVALCPGAGDSELATAARSGADVYVTSDLRHHPALEHVESAADPRAVPALIDVPHAASEGAWLPQLRDGLRESARARGWDLTVEVSTHRTDPWTGAEGAHGRLLA